MEPNGIIINNLVGSAKYPGSEPKGVTVDKVQLEPDVGRYLLEKQDPLTNYVVEILAKTSAGDGEPVRITTRTVEISGKSLTLSLPESNLESIQCDSNF